MHSCNCKATVAACRHKTAILLVQNVAITHKNDFPLHFEP